ncbi:MAG: glutamyl-tRNA reductase [Nitrospirae bacterium CG18_big_fil_WC_8_21_14_2_50_70_55]|nr:glutamyl-tRNA reductase [Deltaproteobacteria bacterium]PIQ07193.1 MAG: glutamyl-tRNA reductase [Nitrospirae bacterium CG18_big_fil_WC_8_21_14_2_50_70_55]PIU77284.1 MAG: glutamyl-tRNA reductase [Nitrospirae bacterium CG06_land_8_20_14_3_00_70_43]PIW83652.1 MAG: glutamyl-tRNA reductase [Nitrospirae bacterium CG_4_8_14_3_um_filter_70_85]PIX83671.1 MAG: glutamyl-tRNA reductase [Nitrospirae bacterium CG_4_10_14_3_um_filter_70_108]PJB95052.1 MAG: glutamyl-tRNA reductase [Nitrospirae bacterium CG_
MKLQLISLGLSHKTAPVELRERLAIPADQVAAEVCRLHEATTLPECLLLSTCNRVEAYAGVADATTGLAALEEFFTHHANGSDVCAHLYHHQGAEAVDHLFRVASSLDSMVVGEPQILGQLKGAFSTAHAAGTTGTILHHAIERAISTAKRVRTETAIARSAVSISFAAVELAKKIFQNLEDKTVMLIGAGEMAELAAQHLISAGVGYILVTNRTYQRAVDLAERFHGSAIRYEDFKESMVRTDIVIASTGARDYVLAHHDMARVMHARRSRSVFFIDISVPRNLDPNIERIDNCYVYDIDDLQQVVDTNKEERLKESERATEIIQEEVAHFLQWLRGRAGTPQIIALRERGARLCEAELTRAIEQLGHLTKEDHAVISELARRLTNKFLHPPTTALKRAMRDGDETAVAILHKMFRIS